MASTKHVFGLKLLIKIKPYNLAVIELVTAGIIWGASFTLVRWALESFSASTLIFWRFILAFTLGEVGFFIFNRSLFRRSFKDAKLAMWGGLFLGVSLFLQTYGLNFTTATNSGFITSLYVVMIPIILALFFKQKLKKRHFSLSLLAFAGMGFLLELSDFQIEKGELLTLGAALTAAFQIIYVGRYASQAVSSFRFNSYQTFWSWVTLLPFLLIETKTQHITLWPENPSLKAILSVATLAIAVSLLAFYLQVRAQRVLSTTTSSMLCLLEGPFAFFFGAIFLGERLNGVQTLGAFLILLSCALSVIFDRPKHGHG